MRLPTVGYMHCKVYACTLRESACIERQITNKMQVFDRYVRYGVTPVYLAKCQSGTCEQGNALRLGDMMREGAITIKFDPAKDFRDQLVPIRMEPTRLWVPFHVGQDAEVAIQASASHRSVPQHTHDDPYKYSAWEVFILRDGQIAMQVQYLETALVQRLLVDLSNDLGNINLSPLRE